MAMVSHRMNPFRCWIDSPLQAASGQTVFMLKMIICSVRRLGSCVVVYFVARAITRWNMGRQYKQDMRHFVRSFPPLSNLVFMMMIRGTAAILNAARRPAFRRKKSTEARRWRQS